MPNARASGCQSARRHPGIRRQLPQQHRRAGRFAFLLFASVSAWAAPVIETHNSARPDRAAWLAEFVTDAQPASPPDAPTAVTAEPATSAAASQAAGPDGAGRKQPAKRPPSTWVPPGFEALLEPQTTQIDVYYGGVFVASSLATFTPTEITLLEPDPVVAAIPDVLNPLALRAALSQPLATNSEQLCLKANQTGCGRLTPEGAEVIFDESTFRADLFVAPGLLAVRRAGVARFLPASDSGPSLLNAVSVSANAQNGEDARYNVSNTATFSWGENRLWSQSHLTDSEDFTVDTLALQRDFRGREYQAGVFRLGAGGLRFIPQSDFVGARIASSLNTRTDLDQSTGANLQVFLESRSRVAIFKDGRLVSSAVYDTGNQIIDTTSLPGGAYEIVLRIRDQFGQERQETRFYAKSSRLPPPDQTLFFLDVGELVERPLDRVLPRATGERLARFGLSRRLRQDFGGEVGLASIDQDQLVETGVFYLGRRWELRASAAGGRGGARGVGLNSRLRMGRSTLSMNFRETRGGGSRVLQDNATQASLNLSFALFGGSASLTSRFNEREGQRDRNTGLRYNFRTLRFGRSTLDLEAQFTEDNDERVALISLRLRSQAGRWVGELSPRFTRMQQPRDDAWRTNVSASWQDRDLWQSDVAFGLRGVAEERSQSLEAELDVASRLGQGNIEATWYSESGRRDYAASFNTSLIANTSGVAIGGRSAAQAAVLLDIQGDADNAHFDVMVNRTVRGRAAIGARTVIGLTPFDTYDVTLEPRGETLVDFASEIKRTTLYPGNVVTMVWKARRVVVAFGEIVDESGKPVANALIQGVVGLATTDELGLFQAELGDDTEVLKVRTRSSECEVSMPPIDGSQLVNLLGRLTCR